MEVHMAETAISPHHQKLDGNCHQLGEAQNLLQSDVNVVNVGLCPRKLKTFAAKKENVSQEMQGFKKDTWMLMCWNCA